MFASIPASLFAAEDAEPASLQRRTSQVAARASFCSLQKPMPKTGWMLLEADALGTQRQDVGSDWCFQNLEGRAPGRPKGAVPGIVFGSGLRHDYNGALSAFTLALMLLKLLVALLERVSDKIIRHDRHLGYGVFAGSGHHSTRCH